MAKNPYGNPHQKTTSKYPAYKDQGPKNKTSPSKSKKMDRSLDDDDDDNIVPSHRHQPVNDDEDADDIVEREDNFDQDIFDEDKDESEEETNEDL